MRQMLDHAPPNFGYGVPAFNVKQSGQMRAIKWEAADKTSSRWIVAGVCGARKYAWCALPAPPILARD